MRARRPRVAIQGERGAFSEQAARRLLGKNVRVVPQPTFESLFRAIGDGKADCVLAPVENSLAGSVSRVYDLMLASRFAIIGEVIEPIAHHLIACRGSSMNKIRTVESHPVALAQCERLFARWRKIRRIAADDTAGSVRNVIASGDETRAAIASLLAAKTYGGKILRKHVEDHKENYTRFLLLGKIPRKEKQGGKKLSLVFRLAHRPGTLHEAIGVFARRGLNLVKIESRPLPGKPWEYCFYADLLIPAGATGLEAALHELKRATRGLRVLGRYQPAVREARKQDAP